MITGQYLAWFNLVAQWLVCLPLLLLVRHRNRLDRFRYLTGAYLLLSGTFNLLASLMARFLGNNLLLYYLVSPVLVVLVHALFNAQNRPQTPVWRWMRWLIFAYCGFVIADMIWLEDPTLTFSTNIYIPEKSLLVALSFYFLYWFSDTASTDFSALWIGLGVGVDALLSLMILCYAPYVNFIPNTIGYFLWYGLGAFVMILNYLFISYGLFIYRPPVSIHA